MTFCPRSDWMRMAGERYEFSRNVRKCSQKAPTSSTAPSAWTTAGTCDHWKRTASSGIRTSQARKKTHVSAMKAFSHALCSSLPRPVIRSATRPESCLTSHPYMAALRPNERLEEHTSELQSRPHLVCRLLLEKKKK